MTTPRTPAGRDTISNVSNGAKLSVADISRHLLEVTGGWPKRVGDGLYVRRPDGGLGLLENADHLMAFMNEYADVDWHYRRDLSPQVFFAGLVRHAQPYEWATAAVHYPPLDGMLYLTDPPEPMATGYLDRLVDRFRPDTPDDRALLTAAFLTPAAGVPAGRRPVYVIVPGEQYAAGPDRGRGCVKSTLAEAAGLLHGGVFHLDSGCDAKQVRTDLLSPAGAGRVVLTLDNLKSNRFSSEFIEKLVTGREVSGHVLYEGYGSRPNHTLFITVNGANLSKDMATRRSAARTDPPRGPNTTSPLRSGCMSNP